MASIKYAPRLPMEVDNEDKFIFLEDALLNIRQKLTMLVLTNPGEKIMDPKFGIGIKKFLFEFASQLVEVREDAEEKVYILQDIKERISSDIREQSRMYFDDMEISNIDIDIVEQVMSLSIKYTYKGYLQDNINITIGT